jgi:hypothetical protein
MSYYFGVDNPYRAPKVAKEVVDYVGVRQEQVIAPQVEVGALDYFYQGFQSFQQTFGMFKDAYEKDAYRQMAKIEDQKAKDILNGMTSEDVNRRYAEAYGNLAQSGSINKRLDAHRDLMKNHVSAKGVVVGDVAQDAVERFSMEIATAGNSYVDQQRIAQKYLRSYEGTQAGELIAEKVRPVLLQAKAVESKATMDRAFGDIDATVSTAIEAGTNNPDALNEYFGMMMNPDPEGGGSPAPALFEDDGTPTLEAQQYIGNRIYESHYAQHAQNLPPQQQEAYRLHAQAQSAALAAGLIKRKGQVDDANRKSQEAADTVADFGLFLQTGEQAYNDLPLKNQTLGFGQLASSNYASAAKTIHDNDENSASLLDFAWGSGDKSFLKQAIGEALSSPNPTNALQTLAASAPPKNVAEAIDLGYAPQGTTQDRWNVSRERVMSSARGEIAGVLNTAMQNQFAITVKANPSKAGTVAANMEADLKKTAGYLELDYDALGLWGSQSFDPAAQHLGDAKAFITYQQAQLSGKTSLDLKPTDIADFGELANLGSSDPNEGILITGVVDSAVFQSGGKDQARADLTPRGQARTLDPFLHSAVVAENFAGSEAQLMSLLLRRGQAREQMSSLSGQKFPQDDAFMHSYRTASEIRSSGLAEKHPMLAQGLFHGTLIGETFQMPGMMGLNPASLPETSQLQAAMRERFDEFVDVDSWISNPDNIRYGASMYDGILKEVSRTVDDPKQATKRTLEILEGMLGENNVPKVLRSRHLRDHYGATDFTDPLWSEGKVLAPRQLHDSREFVSNMQQWRTAGKKHNVELESVVDGVLLTLQTGEIPDEGGAATLAAVAAQKENRNSSFFFGAQFEDTFVARLGIHDRDTRNTTSDFSIAIADDPVIREEFMGLLYKNAATMGLNGDALDLDSGEGPQRYAEQVGSIVHTSFDELLDKYTLQGTKLVPITEANRGTTRAVRGFKGGKDRHAPTEMGESIFTGDLREWADQCNMRDQDFISWWAGTNTADGTIIYQEPKLDSEGKPKLDSEGKPITVERPISVSPETKVVYKMFEDWTIDVDGKDVRFLDYIMTGEDGQVDPTFVQTYQGNLEDDIVGGQKTVQTHLYAMLKTAVQTGKVDAESLGLNEDSFARLGSAGLGSVSLIQDPTVPSGYALSIQGLMTIPWRVPNSITGNEGFNWPVMSVSRSEYRDIDFDDSGLPRTNKEKLNDPSSWDF